MNSNFLFAFIKNIPNSLKMVVEVSDFKTLGLFCCRSNPITARFWLDRMGYVPGEKIYFNAEVENLSRKTMHGSKFQLIEVIKYKDIRLNKFSQLNYTKFNPKTLIRSGQIFMRWVKLSLVSESSVNSHGGNLMTQNFGKTIQSPFHLWSLLSSAFVASSMSIIGLW
jgi:hypothetical protein